METSEGLQKVFSTSNAFLELGRPQEALTLYRSLQRMTRPGDEFYFDLMSSTGWTLVIVGQFEEAIAHYRGLIHVGNGSIRNQEALLAYCYLNVGMVDSASYFVEIARNREEDPSSLIVGCEAALYLSAQDTTAAVLSSEKAVALAQEEARPELLTSLYRRFAEALLGLGLKEEALLVVDSATANIIVRTPWLEVAEAYRTKGVILQRMGRFEEAYDALERYNTVRDSLFVSEAGVYGGGVIRKTAQQNAQLTRRLEDLRAESSDHRNWIIVLLLTLFVSLFFSARYLHTLRKSKWAYAKLQESNRKVVTQSKEIALAQEEIIKSEKMAFLGRVFAGVGHELNTPVAAVKANLQLIEDAQMQEIRKMKELATVFTPSILEIMTELIIASYQAQQNPLSTGKQRALRKTLRSYFEEELDGDPMDFADVFDDLRVYDGLKRFEPIYRHEKGVDILELVMFIAHRTRSIFTAMEALQRADKILFSLKSYSFKNLQDELVKFDLIRNINNIITLHQNKLKNVTVYKQFEETVEIEGYPDELTQVWTNLISNATYANKYRGNLWIRVKQYDDKVQVDIEDSGGGIDPKVKERIFEPFETTKPEGEGTGLGLSITKRVIDKHRGTISVENTSTGALFSVVLPKNLS